MKMRVKSVLTVAFAFAVFMAIIWCVDRWVVHPSFDRLERAQAMEDAMRAGDSVRQELCSLDNMTGSWAVWDDAYAFAESRDQAFIKSGLGDWDSLQKSSNFNLCYIFTRSGEVLYGGIYDSAQGGAMSLAAFSGSPMPAYSYFEEANRLGQSVSGMLKTEKGMLLLVGRPILTTAGKGPSRGMMLLGRFLGAAVVKSLAEQSHVGFGLFTTDDPRLTQAERDYCKSLRPGSRELREIPGAGSFVYEAMQGLDGRTCAILRTPCRHDIRMVGEAMRGTLLLAFGIAGILLLLGAALLSERARLWQVASLDALGWGVVTLVALAGLAATCLVYWEMRRTDRAAMEGRLQNAVAEVAAFADDELGEALERLESSARLFASGSEGLDDSLAPALEGLPDFSVAAWILPADSGFKVAWARRHGGEGFAPAPGEAFPGCEEAMEKAITSGLPSVTGLSKLPPWTGEGAKRACIVFVPVFGESPVKLDEKGRLLNLKGLVAGVLRIEAIVLSGVSFMMDEGFALEFHDLDSRDGAAPVFRRPDAPLTAAPIGQSKDISLAGRDFRISCLSTDEFAARYFGPSRWMIVAAGLLLTVFASLYLSSLIGQRRRADEIASMRTQELHQNERFLHSILHSIGDGVICTDMDGKVLRMNKMAETMTGWFAVEAYGKPFCDIFNIINAHSGAKVECPVRKVLETGVALGLANDTTLIARDGARRQIADSAAPIRDDSGRVHGVVLVFSDVTESYAFKESLKESEEWHRVLYEASHDAIMIMEPPDWGFTGGNPATVRLFEANGEAQLRGTGPWDLSPPVQPDGEPSGSKAKRMIDIALEKGSHIFEWTSRRFNGELFPSTVLLARMELKGKVFLKATVRDISRQKAMEEQLLHARKLEAIGQLAAGIAHEINTPTQFIGDNISFLKDSFNGISAVLVEFDSLIEAVRKGAASPGLAAHAEEAAKSADLDYLRREIPQAIQQSQEGVERIAKIVGAMKDFSHMGFGEKAPTDINKALEMASVVSRNTWKYVAEMSMEFDPALPRVHCLSSEINQVFLNLIVNGSHAIEDAKKADPGRKGLIRITTRQDGDCVEVRICDNGSGIKREHHARIFEPFFTTKEVGKGTGQGLALSYQTVVKRHGGTIRFETESGRGTTFIVRLPVDAKGEAGRPEAPGKAGS